jgi:hypothetical protein
LKRFLRRYLDHLLPGVDYPVPSDGILDRFLDLGLYFGRILVGLSCHIKPPAELSVVSIVIRWAFSAGGAIE